MSEHSYIYSSLKILVLFRNTKNSLLKELYFNIIEKTFGKNTAHFLVKYYVMENGI